MVQADVQPVNGQAGHQRIQYIADLLIVFASPTHMNHVRDQLSKGAGRTQCFGPRLFTFIEDEYSC